jgi:hypothetical protein
VRKGDALFGRGEKTVFRHAYKMGRKVSPYRSGRSPDWLMMKNPACTAMQWEAEEDWTNRSWK